jgi:predicted amidohydrolase
MATVLVLPELVVSPATLETVKTRLKKNGVDGYPILTLLGLSHREGTEGCVNEAVLLGPGGEELHRHRKMSCFTHGSAGQEAGEDNQTGFDLIVLESAIGTISTPICLDLFQEDVAAARSRLPVDLLLVPSLSDTTSAHLAQAKLAAASVHRTSTFVCNRRLLTQPTRERPEGSSFFLLPVTRSREGGPLQEKGDRQSPGHPNGKNHPKPGEVHHHPAHSDKPALVFSLIDLLGP